jgi:hypothetical protein
VDADHDRVLARIADIEQTLRQAESEDVRDVLLVDGTPRTELTAAT